MIVSEDHEVDTRLSAQAKLQEAYKFFGKIEDNDEEMINFLKIYGKKVPYDATSMASSPLSMICLIVSRSVVLVSPDT